MFNHQASISVEICQDENGQAFVRNKDMVYEIVRTVEGGKDAAILGGRHNQKSLLLKDVKKELEKKAWPCVLVDLLDLKEVEKSEFLNEFANTFEQQRKFEKVDVENPPRLAEVKTDPSSLETFLMSYTGEVPKLALLIDHPEKIQIESLESLFDALIGFHNTQQRSTSEWRILVASSGNLSSSSSHTSFLDISHPFWIPDMTLSESRELIRFIMRQNGTTITSSGEQRLFDATKGDRYLLPILAEHCASLISRSGKEGGEADADKAFTWFVNEWAKAFPPLRGNVRAVARDTIALMNVCKVLAQGRVSEQQLMLDHKNDVYNLRLTGVISENENESERYYSIKNEFYERYLKDNFRPDHLPHILSIAGGWENAINYLNRLVTDFPQYRPVLLSKAVDFIHRAEDETAACDYLIRQAGQIFSLAKAKVYLVKPVRSHLEQRGQIGFDDEPKLDLSLENDLPEVTAYKTQDFYIDHENSNGLTILVPLLRNDGRSVGVFGVYGFEGNIHEENFLELLAYCKRAGRAVGSVMDRQRRSLQLMTLNKTGQEVTSSLERQRVMQTTVDAAIESVPGAQRGVLFMWNEEQQKLVIEALGRPHLFEDKNIKEVVKLDHGQGYAGHVFATGEPLSIGNVGEHRRVKFKDHPDIKKQKSVLSVPLKVWDRIIGVLSVDNIAAFNAFKNDDVELLSTFAAQAAIALQNAQLYTELTKRELTIDNSTPSVPEIFIETVKRIFVETVQSIKRITGAKGAHMLLLRDIEDENISVADKVELSTSVGMGKDYDEKIKPRPDGLTFQVLRDRKYHAVSSLHEPPGINPLAAERGIRAYICLPMEARKNIIGILFVYYTEQHRFTEIEIEMLSLFCNQAALAIQNVKQREELEIMESVTWMGIQFSDMEHTIRQELASMKAGIDLLRDEIPQHPTALDVLHNLEEFVTKTERILGDAPLHIRMTPSVVELNKQLRVEIARWCPKDDKIELDFTKLSQEEILVAVDEHFLAIVVKILTTNAVRALKSDSTKRLTISSTTRTGKDREYAEVRITNTGKPIPADIKERLFKEPIGNVPGVRGSGVGLLIAWSILVRSGGTIKLSKSDLTGTTFTFSLPLIKSKTEPKLLTGRRQE